MTTEPVPADKAASYRARLLASDDEFSSEWLAERDKVVVPLEEVGTFTEDPASRIVRYFRSEGDDRLLCMTTSDLGPDEPAQAAVVSSDAQSLDDWWAEVRPFSIVVASLGLERALLVSVDEFALIAGTPTFVEGALGRPLSEARAAFASYADDMREASHHLPAVAAKYGCVG
ncbi:MAG TPA: hypothetical protein VIL34_08135 [Actinopolymorphaceae bacterium]|jgi:hypothetical protein